MSSRRLASSRTAALSPLGTAGQRAYEVVRREAAALGPEYEALFAEPFLSPDGDLIDWYATARGPVSPLASAPEDRRAAGQARLDALLSGLIARADALSADADPEKRRLGEALRNATEVPEESSVYLVGEQPVLINWAHRANAERPRTGVLTGKFAAPVPPEPAVAAVAAPPPEPPAPTPAVERGPRSFGWLWWALWASVGGLAAAIAWLLLPACGVDGPDWLNWCPEPQIAAPPAIDRTPELRAELDALERALLDLDAGCRRPALDCVRPPTETALLLDASSSMTFGIETPPEVERELFEIVQRLNEDGSFASEEDARRYSDLVRGALAPAMGEPRWEALRRALGEAAGMTEPLRTRVTPFAACGRLGLGDVVTTPDGMRAAVDAVELESYTALAYAIGQAAASLDGGRTADDPVNLVVISDGFDTCGGDPCAAARSAKQARPGLAIDVVDLVGLPELRCVATETGGRYVDASGGVEPALIAQLLSDAASRERAEICRTVPEERLSLPPEPPTDRAEAPPPSPEPPRDDFAERVEEAGGETEAPIKVTLIWDTASDLDLWVTCPTGETINFESANACGGFLDVDRNAGTPVARPVENVTFSAPAPGPYRVEVRNFSQRDGGPDAFQLRIERDGAAETHSGSLAREGDVAAFDFEYP